MDQFLVNLAAGVDRSRLLLLHVSSRNLPGYCEKVRYPTCTSVADPDPGSGAFLNPGSGIQVRDGKKSGSEQFFYFFGLKILKFLYTYLDPDPGSGIKIPDRQY